MRAVRGLSNGLVPQDISHFRPFSYSGESSEMGHFCCRFPERKFLSPNRAAPSFPPNANNCSTDSPKVTRRRAPVHGCLPLASQWTTRKRRWGRTAMDNRVLNHLPELAQPFNGMGVQPLICGGLETYLLFRDKSPAVRATSDVDLTCTPACTCACKSDRRTQMCQCWLSGPVRGSEVGRGTRAMFSSAAGRSPSWP